MTPRTFFNALEGWNTIYRTEMEVKRLQTLYSLNVWAKTPIQDPKRLWKYSWETKPKKIKGEKEAKEQVKRGKELARKWRTK